MVAQTERITQGPGPVVATLSAPHSTLLRSKNDPPPSPLDRFQIRQARREKAIGIHVFGRRESLGARCLGVPSHHSVVSGPDGGQLQVYS